MVENGRIRHAALGAGTISLRELLMELRLQGVRDIGEIDKAFFEPCGQVSVIPADADSRNQERSTLPQELDERKPRPEATER